ncbi:hypothetical protein KGF57_003609 [Candida theae]|uniref:Inositol phosphorylceramide synthase regulatory subunit KEI1 n=1 Tax=Candida theae TaxID=1198502 RepID=A0AAD5BD40_9ASCO|nr:uncharacterized protein KGF57_003609 [Candida theae]KAI5955477.1 hypothetical protein KGF57_003609 [Candida theae]
MAIPSSLQRLLPQKFLGFIPLFIGVEVILGITILNKAGGLYGILSLFTGHPIDFWQWLYNSLALIMLPVYATALINLRNQSRNLRKISLATVVYLVDTIIGTLYTIYFVIFWFHSEDGSTEEVGGAALLRKRKEDASDTAANLSSQSASTGRELFFIFAATIAMSVIRVYFALVIVSFTKALLKKNSMEQRYRDGSNDNSVVDTEENEILNSTGIYGEFRKAILDLEIRSKELLDELLN